LKKIKANVKPDFEDFIYALELTGARPFSEQPKVMLEAARQVVANGLRRFWQKQTPASLTFCHPYHKRVTALQSPS